jgi:hypothetical protein
MYHVGVWGLDLSVTWIAFGAVENSAVKRSRGGSEWLWRGVESKARDFTPFTPFSGFSVQALISRWFAVVRMHSRGRIWSLFSIAYQIPKMAFD